MAAYRPRPLGLAQIGKSERVVRARLATHPADDMARLAGRALAALRAEHERAEAEEDAAALAAYEATRGEETVPSEVVGKLISGANKLRVWRKHRGYTMAKLADLAGLSVSYISEIERGVKDGSIAAMRKLSTAMDLDLDDLIETHHIAHHPSDNPLHNRT